MSVKCAVIGAGSRSFGSGTVQDLLLSEPLCARGLEMVLMDVKPAHLEPMVRHAQKVCAKLGRKVTIRGTTDLDDALKGAGFVFCAIEVDRYLYWSQDFHVPRDYGFRQPYGENGGVGGIFHALRNMGPMVHIARRMEALCPGAVLLSYTNPEHKLCEAITSLTSVETYGLCHGVFMGQSQIASILGVPEADLVMSACGINHFTWFQEVRDRKTGADLYPRLKEIERGADAMTHWHEIGLGRVLLRRFGLWPSPGANHYGEYIRWADEYVVSNLQFLYEPTEGFPWKTGRVPEFLYDAGQARTDLPWQKAAGNTGPGEELGEIKPSGEIGTRIVESRACGIAWHLEAVNVPNHGYVPGLDEGTVVEVPAEADGKGVRPRSMPALPLAITAMLRVQGAIQKLLVEAFVEESKDKLLQALLLEPTVDSYRRAVDMTEHMLELQKGILPPLR